MSSKSLAIWSQSLAFHIGNWRPLLPVFRLLCLPVVGDVLHSLLIAQKVRGTKLLPAQAVREVWSLIPSVLGMKLYFEGAAILWSLVPIYGIIRDIRHHLHWAMLPTYLSLKSFLEKPGVTVVVN